MAAPVCPRCTYDLSGMVASWTAVCPLRAVCSECGLEFECANVLSPRMLGPAWSYEHGPRPLPGRWWRTTAMALRPRRLCKELRIDHAIRVGRLVRFMVLWLLIVHVTLAVWQAWMTSLVSAWLGSGPVRFGRGAAALMDRSFINELGANLLFPYGGTMDVPVAAGRWARLEIGSDFLLTAALTFLMPVWMCLLGTTFAAAKVRRVHLLRGLAYSVPAGAIASLAIPGLAALAVWADSVAPTTGSMSLAVLVFLIAIVIFPLYHGAWWWLFIRRYLRLRHALATVLLLEVTSGLVLVILVTTYENWRHPY